LDVRASGRVSKGSLFKLGRLTTCRTEHRFDRMLNEELGAMLEFVVAGWRGWHTNELNSHEILTWCYAGRHGKAIPALARAGTSHHGINCPLSPVESFFRNLEPLIVVVVSCGCSIVDLSIELVDDTRDVESIITFAR